jgi:hypothetical protein
MVDSKKSPLSGPQEELKKLRFAEMDAAYVKQLKALSRMVRASRLNVQKLRRHL